MTSSTGVVLDYGHQTAHWSKAVLRVLFRVAILLGVSVPIGAALVHLLVPTVFTAFFRIYEQPPAPTSSAPRSNALYTRAALLESPAFVSAVIAPLISSNTLTKADAEEMKVHAEVGRKDDIITVNVQHHDPQKAVAIVNALLTATRNTPPNFTATGAISPTSQPNDVLDPVEVRLARALTAVVQHTVVVQPPLAPSQLKPHFTRQGQVLAWIIGLLPTVTMLWVFRKQLHPKARPAA